MEPLGLKYLLEILYLEERLCERIHISYQGLDVCNRWFEDLVGMCHKMLSIHQDHSKKWSLFLNLSSSLREPRNVFHLTSNLCNEVSNAELILQRPYAKSIWLFLTLKNMQSQMCNYATSIFSLPVALKRHQEVLILHLTIQ